MKLPVPLERDVKRAVMDLLRKLGATVYNLDQGFRPGGKRHGTTRQTKGLGDLYVQFRLKGVAFWIETKRLGGTQSAEQIDFEVGCRACGVGYVVGGVAEVIAHLRTIGFGFEPTSPGRRTAPALPAGSTASPRG